MPPIRHLTDRDSLERDCVIEFFRGGGPGGQHRNKTSSGVRLTHVPTGIAVMATERRSQSQNIEAAFARMAARLDHLQQVRRPRIPTRPSRGSVERRLTAKRSVARKKAERKVEKE